MLRCTKSSSVVNHNLIPIILNIRPVHQVDLREVLGSLESVSNGRGHVEVRRVGEEGEELIVGVVWTGVVALFKESEK